MIDHPHTYIDDKFSQRLISLPLSNWQGIMFYYPQFLLANPPLETYPIQLSPAMTHIKVIPELWARDDGSRYVRWFVSEKPDNISLEQAKAYVEENLEKETNAKPME